MTSAHPHTGNIDQGMRGHAPVTVRKWDSIVLDRRILIDKVPLLSDDDLRNLRLELQEILASLKVQIELNNEADPEWVRRAYAKLRIAQLFSSACWEEGDARRAAIELERSRQKTIRAVQDRDQNRRRAAKRARVIHDLLLQEWGPERTDAFYDRADELAGALLEQEAAQAKAQGEKEYEDQADEHQIRTSPSC